jgi:hypothetical protein
LEKKRITMAKKKSHSVIMADKYLSESGIQGGKIVANKISLASLIVGIPFFIIGVFALIGMVFNLGFPSNPAIIIAALLLTIIGLLLIIGAYTISKTKKDSK